MTVVYHQALFCEPAACVVELQCIMACTTTGFARGLCMSTHAECTVFAQRGQINLAL